SGKPESVLNTGFRPSALFFPESLIGLAVELPAPSLTKLPGAAEGRPRENGQQYGNSQCHEYQPVRNVARPRTNRALQPRQSQHGEYAANHFVEQLPQREPEPPKAAFL